jgi:acyl carrier protein
VTEETIRAFLRDRFRASIGSRPLDPDTPLFSSGIVDSFGVLELIAFLDDTFGVNIDPARHELAEFDTISKIAALVTRLQRPATDN